MVGFFECKSTEQHSASWLMATKLRKTGLSIVGDLPWGMHLCLFHETKEDLLDTLVPYFKTGLESNEFCVWAVSEPLTQDEARLALSQGIPAFDQYLAAGSIEILRGHEWYLKDGRGEPKSITAGWHAKLRAALAQGHEGMRVSGNAFWLNTNHWKEFREYEQEVNGSFAGWPMIALCTYPLAASRPTDILDVARAHGLTVARRKGRWEFIEAAEAPTKTHSLTPRELEALTWVARGKSAWEIGEILHITKRTVDEHVRTAVRKLGAANRTQAVAIALRRRIIEFDTSTQMSA
jgi:DNA-binding CsgD family transcriptional regulator